jgi:hypothetical protein
LADEKWRIGACHRERNDGNMLAADLWDSLHGISAGGI